MRKRSSRGGAMVALRCGYDMRPRANHLLWRAGYGPARPGYACRKTQCFQYTGAKPPAARHELDKRSPGARADAFVPFWDRGTRAALERSATELRLRRAGSWSGFRRAATTRAVCVSPRFRADRTAGGQDNLNHACSSVARTRPTVLPVPVSKAFLSRLTAAMSGLADRSAAPSCRRPCVRVA